MTLPGYKLIDPDRTAMWRRCNCGLTSNHGQAEPPPARPPVERIITEGGLVLTVCSRCRGLRSDG